MERVLRWVKIFDHDRDDQKNTPIEISGMEPFYRKMMNMKNVQNFFPDMLGQKFLAYGRNFCHFW